MKGSEGKSLNRELLSVKFETHGLPGVRWKNVDLWESRRGNEFLPPGLNRRCLSFLSLYVYVCPYTYM